MHNVTIKSSLTSNVFWGEMFTWIPEKKKDRRENERKRNKGEKMT